MSDRPICKIRIERWGSTVVMQVLEQSEALREISDDLHTDHIASNVMPALRTDRIHIRGVDTDDDNKVASLTLEDAKTADEYIVKVRGWFDEWRTQLGLDRQENPNPMEVLDEVAEALRHGRFPIFNMDGCKRVFDKLRQKYTCQPSEPNIIEL